MVDFTKLIKNSNKNIAGTTTGFLCNTKSRLEEIAYERGYRVSENGIVTNLKGDMLKCGVRNKKRKNSYMAFTLKIDEKSKHCSVHRLQAYLKYGNKLYGIRTLVRHLDGNPHNNAYDNIEIGKPLDNYRDIPLQDRQKRMIDLRAKNSKKYSDDLKLLVKQDYLIGMTRTEISNKYNIPLNSVYYIVKK